MESHTFRIESTILLLEKEMIARTMASTKDSAKEANVISSVMFIQLMIGANASVK